MADVKQRKGVIEWLTTGIPLAVVAVSLIVYISTTRVQLDEKCERFTEAIKRIETDGTRMSAQNALDIASLKPRMDGMDKKLDELADGQKEMIRYLRGARSPGSP